MEDTNYEFWLVSPRPTHQAEATTDTTWTTLLSTRRTQGVLWHIEPLQPEPAQNEPKQLVTTQAEPKQPE